ncbi:MAG: LuxR family transcriptional regulator [Chloroflexi bacterium]|nr:MAG: LuxR family transcriptional regulator [Chloroflexota bacterium]
MRPDLPMGTVTFLFTDVEGSTRLLQEVGADAYAAALAEHHRILRQAFQAHAGVEVNTQGDAFLAAFTSASEAVAAATDAQRALGGGPIHVRMGLHTGKALLTNGDYVGLELHRGARIAAAAHGGQIVLSRATRVLLGEGLPLRDLGEHRVRDFEEPVWIFQIGKTIFPPLKTISNTNLPKPVSSFVGREREVSEIVALLRDGARLVTLTGPGGSGKTRLAIEVGSELVPEHRNGVFWVGLAPLRDPTLVSETIRRILGAKSGLAGHIGDKQMLLLLDNFEQVVEAAPGLAALLEACPNLRLLVTSREVLRVRGEVDYGVPPLADPEAIELFCARARVNPDETVAELCRRLDSLPLALELAAARTSVLTVDQILERLSQRLDLLKGGRDAEARQQTLRATIAWSYQLLAPEEQRLFAALSVFAGGYELEAAEAVAGARLDILQSLIDKSLVRYREGRYWMLETIGEFASERLEESGEADKLHRRQAEHFLAMAEEAEPHLRDISEKGWLDRLQRDHDNIRAALDWFERSGETQHALRLVGALSRFYYLRGHFLEGRRRLEHLLSSDDQPTAARGKALNGAAVLDYNTGEMASARSRAEDALTINRRLGEAWATAYSQFMLGNIVHEQGDHAGALRFYEESERTFRALGDDFYMLLTISNVAWVYERLGDHERNRTLHLELLRRARELGIERLEAQSLGQLAMYLLDRGRVEEAPSMLRDSIRIHHKLDDPWSTAIDLRRFAYALAVERKPLPAARLLAKAVAQLEEIGSKLSWIQEFNEKTRGAIRAQLDEATFAEAWAQGRAMSMDEAVALALRS